jgi:hypothetical protein
MIETRGKCVVTIRILKYYYTYTFHRKFNSEFGPHYMFIIETYSNVLYGMNIGILYLLV